MKRFDSFHQRIEQRGAVLVIALIMLLLTTLIVVASFQMGTSNLIVMTNLEDRFQLEKSAQAAIEALIHQQAGQSQLFVSCPVNFPPVSQEIDLNGDGIMDVRVDFEQPRCVGTDPVTDVDLDWRDPGDHACMDPRWPCDWLTCDIRAIGRDLASDAEARVRQGVRVRVLNVDLAVACAP
ncbi:hypothetical protein [Thiocapsa sp.]|uniref:hypothetical protein n=1 Tax=Thiocapsa sp. TaxID=2024551 RepID=UPI001BD08149|nr:hypothetical protein [Thiocapsa sp.]